MLLVDLITTQHENVLPIFHLDCRLFDLVATKPL